MSSRVPMESGRGDLFKIASSPALPDPRNDNILEKLTSYAEIPAM